MTTILHCTAIIFLTVLTASATWAQNKVVVVPIGNSLRPGTVVEGTLNNPILTVTNNESSGIHGSAISAHGSSPTAPAITATHHGAGSALYGSSNSYYPTVAGNNQGVGQGVRGDSVTGVGVLGYVSNSAGIGIAGMQTGYATSDFTTSLSKPGGMFGGRIGIVGITKANSGYAVMGSDQSATGGWAGRFVSSNGNGISISTSLNKIGLSISGGTKNAIVATSDGARLMYSEESTQVWFTDYGFGQIQDGSALVAFDPIFTQTVNLSMPYHVFLQPYGDASLFVTNRTANGFEVHLRGGDANVEFSYRIVALRVGHESSRLERSPWADNDPNLYPDKEGL